MISSDNANYVTVDMFNNAMNAVNQRFTNIDNTLAEIRAEIRVLDRKTEANTIKIDMLQTSVYWGFAIMALVVAFIGCVLTLAPMFREIYKDSKRSRDENMVPRSEIQGMIDEAIKRALGTKQ